MNLTGHWIGKYTYGKGYSPHLAGRSEPFEFHLIDTGGSVSGSCIDNIVKAVNGNESYIVGTFTGKVISFKKRYKFHTATNEKGNLIILPETKSNGIDYTGILRKKMFTKKIYFVGKWSITMQLKDYTGQLQTFTATGTWKMKQSK